MGITFFRSFSYLTQRKGINGAKQVLWPKKKQTPKCNTPQKKQQLKKNCSFTQDFLNKKPFHHMIVST